MAFFLCVIRGRESSLARRTAPSTSLKAGRGGCPRVNLAAIPVELAAVAVNVAILAPEFPALMARGSIVAVVEIAPQFAPIMINPRIVVADVAPDTVVAVPCKSGRHAHSD